MKKYDIIKNVPNNLAPNIEISKGEKHDRYQDIEENQRRKSRLCGFSLYRYLRQIPPYQRAAGNVDSELLTDGKNFDGSSIEGWRGIENSDMVLVPDLTTAVIDPFIDEKTMLLTCDAWEPSGKKGYNRCPRTIATAAMAY